MILYDPDQRHSLEEFGIEIPVMDSRASETFARLESHPVIGPKKAAWHIARIEEKITREDLLRAHTVDHVDRLLSDRLESEIIQTYELIDEQGNPYRHHPQNAKLALTELFGRIIKRVGGTAQCCRIALERGFCFYFGGGMHHAQRDRGAGFCLVNDVVIALRKLQFENRIRNTWVIDVDAHKGDGTAAITAGDESIRTLSIHMARGWPLDQPEMDASGRRNPSFIPSDIDIPIPEGEEARFNPRLREGLHRIALFPRPDLALVVCGSDSYELDELPSTAGLRLSLDQLMQRDRLVYGFLKDRAIPAAYLMAGGYGRNSWRVYTQFLEWALLDRL